MNAQPVRALSDYASSSPPRLSPTEQLQYARNVIRVEGQHLTRLATQIDHRIVSAAEMLIACRGNVIVSGIGKAGIIGQKLSATLCSTGTRSHFLHSAEAIHGDLGKVGEGDVVVVLSHSGKTEEIVRLLPSLATQAEATIGITSSSDSPLGRNADVVIEIGSTDEVCSLGLAPSTSTTAMLAVCDALALLTSHLRGFEARDFARFHPGGSLGLKLSSVADLMRPLERCRIASDRTSVRDILVSSSGRNRRTGAVMLTGESGILTGIFTDSDLARLLECRREQALDGPIADVMSRGVTTVRADASLTDAIHILADRHISELPVTNDENVPVGLIDITDVVGLLPPEPAEPDGSDAPNVLPLRPAG